jgi:2-iminobutanoate/2-iminopropanoate deaminase
MRRRGFLFLAGLAGAFAAQACSKSARSEKMKKPVQTDKAPKAIGPYSQGVIAGGMVYCSGQIAIDPASGELNTGSIEEQTRLVLRNLGAVLEAAGSSTDKVVKATVFLQDMNDFAQMNAVYGEFFKPPYPARAAVQVARLPRDVKVEIEAVAVVG